MLNATAPFLFLLGFKPVQHSSVSQKRNGTVLNE